MTKHDSQHNTEELLALAKASCEKNGARLTPVREQVFKLLADHHGAIGAYDLLDQLKVIDPAAKPATIYRALDFLSKQSFVHKIESINAFILCHHFDGCSHPVQLLICDNCLRVEEIQSSHLDLALRTMADTAGFTIKNQIVEAHGLCKTCKAEQSLN